MAIPAKQLNLIVELMCALPIDGTKYEYHPDVELVPSDEVYIGYFDETILNKMQSIGVITIVGHHDDEKQSIKIVERDDFLAGFAVGASEARIGNDMLYADYNSNQYAFTAGYQHWTNRNSKRNKPARYNSENEYVCHGFIDQSTGEIHQQR